MTDPTDEELNKRMHEIMGLCWHECQCMSYEDNHFCRHCKREYYDYESPLNVYVVQPKYNFLTWEGFGIAWEWLQKHERWSEFLDYCMAQVYHNWDCIPIDIHTILPLPENIVSPRALAEAIVEFFKEDG